jgi:hypothetical protein
MSLFEAPVRGQRLILCGQDTPRKKRKRSRWRKRPPGVQMPDGGWIPLADFERFCSTASDALPPKHLSVCAARLQAELPTSEWKVIGSWLKRYRSDRRKVRKDNVMVAALFNRAVERNRLASQSDTRSPQCLYETVIKLSSARGILLAPFNS